MPFVPVNIYTAVDKVHLNLLYFRITIYCLGKKTINQTTKKQTKKKRKEK